MSVRGNASSFGVRFLVKRSPNLRTFMKVLESPFTTYFGPVGVGGSGYYRAIAINDSTWLNTTASITITTN